MSHPVEILHYACGHSGPVRGANGGTTSRVCPPCEQPKLDIQPLSAPRRTAADFPDLARILGTRRPTYDCSVMNFEESPND